MSKVTFTFFLIHLYVYFHCLFYIFEKVKSVQQVSFIGVLLCFK